MTKSQNFTTSNLAQSKLALDKEAPLFKAFDLTTCWHVTHKTATNEKISINGNSYLFYWELIDFIILILTFNPNCIRYIVSHDTMTLQ